MAEERYAVVMTTCSTREDAQTLARGLVNAHLAACVQMLNIESVYRWQGQVHQDPEILLLVKTRADLYPQVEAYLRQHHPYEVPEILQVPVQQGLASYLSWVDEQTGRVQTS